MLRVKIISIPEGSTEPVEIEDNWQVFRTHCDRGDWSLLLVDEGKKTIQRLPKGKPGEE